MRYAILCVLGLALVACSDDDSPSKPTETKTKDAGVTHPKPDSGSTKPVADAGHTDAGKPKTSKLSRPDELPRIPKTGLPDDLRPPR